MSDEPVKIESRFTHVRVKLVGNDGNAFAIIGAVLKALRANGATKEEQDAFRNEATSGDYDNVITTACRWVDVY